MADWSIRKAVAADAAKFAACIDAAYSKYDGQVADLPAVSDGIADDIANHIVRLAVSGNQIIGGIVLITKQDHLVLANVAVDPAAAGKGIGRALMDNADAEARKLGFEKLQLSTHADMPDNVRLYEHLGWRETGRSGNKVIMEKTLSSPP